MKQLWADFWAGFCHGLRPLLKAMPIMLTGLTATTMALLLGIGMILAAKSLDSPYGTMVSVGGKFFVVVGSLIGLAAAVYRWLMFVSSFQSKGGQR